MQKILLYLFFFTGCLSFGQTKGVGINKLVPEQQLHLGSQTGTIRIDGLNATNNSYNGGEVDKTYPLYVDSNGDMTLEISAFENSDGDDEWTTAGINGTITIDNTGPDDGYEVVEILDIPITVDRDVMVELKYSLSMEVFENSSLDIIKDVYARNITNFFTVDQATLTSTTRRYAQSSKCYYNRNITEVAPTAATGFIYNSGTTYIPLTAGAHILRFYGSACSGINNEPTYVRFAGGPDAIFVRIY